MAACLPRIGTGDDSKRPETIALPAVAP